MTLTISGSAIAASTGTGPAGKPSTTGGGANPGVQTIAPGISVKSDGWIQYRSTLAPSRAESKTARVAGRRNAEGGCSLPGSGRAAADDNQVTYVEEVGYNPATCEFDLQTTHPTPRQLGSSSSRLETSSAVNSTASSAVAGAKPATDGLQAAAATYSRYLKTSWIDPINITISSQTVALQWTAAAWLKWAYKRDSFKGCIGSVCLDETYIVSGSDSLTTLSDGWRKQANVHFRNTSFAWWVVGILGSTGWAACGFPSSSTANFHHQDIVTGYKSGGSAWSWDDSKDGACTNLVHHGSETAASYPL